MQTNINIRLTKLKELNAKFRIPRIRKPPLLETAHQAVIDKVQLDITHGNGPIYFKTMLQQEGLMIPRFVRKFVSNIVGLDTSSETPFGKS
jgi:hypothetical protein